MQLRGTALLCLFFFKKSLQTALHYRGTKVTNRLSMPKHLITFYPGEKKISVDEGENLLHTAMEAEIHIKTSFDVITNYGKCEIKPLRAETTSQKHPRTKSILRKKRFLQGQSDRWMLMHLLRNKNKF